MNFNNLPCDLKLMIFKINRLAQREEYLKNKKTFNEVIEHVKELGGYVLENYGLLEENEYDGIENENSISESIFEELMDRKIAYSQEFALDKYLDGCDDMLME